MTVVVAVGLCTVDLVQRVTAIPTPGQKLQSTTVEIAAGGPATNAAVAVAAMGGHARLSTVLGAHPLATLAANDLSQCGVSLVDVLPDRAAPPPVSAVTVRTTDGERTVVSHNAAGVTAPATVDLTDADVLLLDGHHPELAMHAAERAHERGIPVVLDAGSWKPVMTELLSYVDVCASSATFHSPAPLTNPVVIRTNGPNPVVWHTGDDSGKVTVPPVATRDTAGAGDVWHGALALAIGRLGTVPTAMDLPPIINFANQAAAVRVQHEGARSWVEPMLAMTW